MSIVSRIEGLEQELGLAPHSTSTLYRAREIATALTAQRYKADLSHP
jgi:hypothetical protein